MSSCVLIVCVATDNNEPIKSRVGGEVAFFKVTEYAVGQFIVISMFNLFELSEPLANVDLIAEN